MAEYFLNETRIIYDIEKHCDQHQFTPAQRAVVRQQHLKPILENLKGWLKEHQPNFPPDSPIGKAFTYAANHWHMLFKLCDDGRILPDNNEIERVLRPVTLYRKNSLFAGNEHGAERAALFFTLVENCKLHNIAPFEYLCDVYDRIYDCPASELEELLPHKWVKKEQPEA